MAIATIAGEGTKRLAVTKVIEGKRYVSCTCCTPADITCCLLDTQLDLDIQPNGAITQDKLPPTIVLDGVTYSVGTLGYGNTTNGVFLESGVWAVYKSGVRTTRRCLISNIATDIEDEFDETLTVTYSYNGLTVTCSLLRTNLCLYEGSFIYDGDEYFVEVYQNGPFADQEGNVWTVRAPYIFVTDFGSGPETYVAPSYNRTANISNQPVGTYTGDFVDDQGTLVSINILVTAP
jgi:hypothetical protein